MKVFVTGGAGFIGSHLVDRLMSEGNEVTVYDNLASGKRKWIEQHLGKKEFGFVEADLLDYNTLEKSMKGHMIVWHLGANTDIPAGNKATDIDLKNCTIATREVLEAMRQNGIGKIVFTSSAAVYGEDAPVSASETFGPLRTISLYGAGKLAGEGLVSAYCHLFGMKAWVFRLGNVVGARMGHAVILDFVRKLKRNPNELEILGDGKQERCFLFVEECVDAMLHAIKNSDSNYNIFNLSGESSTNVDRVAQIVCQEMKLDNVVFKYTGGRYGWPGDVPVIRLNVDKLKKIGWSAKYSSEEAVRIAAKSLLEEL